MSNVSHRGINDEDDPVYIDVRDYGAVGDGSNDDTVAIQAAITANPGRIINFKKGRYKTTTTLFITEPGTHLSGEFANRFTPDNGTEIKYYGTGACIQIGVDNGHAWDASDYDGPQDHVIENLWVSAGDKDTPLTIKAAYTYKAGTVGIQDWRGGGLKMHNVGIEGFEYNFLGINSDISNWDSISSFYSKYGLYLGPLSDQNTISNLLCIFCDTAITIDCARGIRINYAQLVGCGHATSYSINIKQGSGQVTINDCWFEHFSSGYAGTDGLAFVGAGMEAGYNSTTTGVVGVSVVSPLVYTVAVGQAGHKKYIIALGKANGVELHNPRMPPGISLGNLSALVGTPLGLSYTASEASCHITGAESNTPYADLFENLGSGAPSISAVATGTVGVEQWARNGRFFFNTADASAGADSLRLSQDAVGEMRWLMPNYSPGQTLRFRLARSWQPGVAAPVAGTYDIGDIIWHSAPSSGGNVGWVCTASGTPGTWKSFGTIA